MRRFVSRLSHSHSSTPLPPSHPGGSAPVRPRPNPLHRKASKSGGRAGAGGEGAGPRVAEGTWCAATMARLSPSLYLSFSQTGVNPFSPLPPSHPGGSAPGARRPWPGYLHLSLSRAGGEKARPRAPGARRPWPGGRRTRHAETAPRPPARAPAHAIERPERAIARARARARARANEAEKSNCAHSSA